MKPLVIVGSLAQGEREEVLALLCSLRAPLYIEALSGLRGHPALSSACILHEIPRRSWESVVRVGGVPICRFWRDLEEKFGDRPVFNFASRRSPWPGLARTCETNLRWSDLGGINWSWAEEELTELRRWNEERDRRRRELFERYPRSEVSLMRSLASQLSGKTLYLGNSLPVRHWDLVAPDVRVEDIFANRGANGIDGQISTFLGWTAAPGPEAWAIVGDLTAMYDLAAPWVSSQLSRRPRRIVVLNNGGGMIFKNLFKDDRLLSRHGHGFSHWAALWGWHYECWEQVPDLSARKFPDHMVVEVRPEERESDEFHDRWLELP